MFQKSLLAAISLGALIAGCLLTAQEQPTPPPGNNEIIKMLGASVPESVLLGEIELMASQGTSFDISPAAIVELRQRGASERVLNQLVWAQTTIVPGVDIPVTRGVFYRSGANATPLNSFLLWAEFSPRWSTWPFYSPDGKEVAQTASPTIIQLSDSTPTLVVQGFGTEQNWQLVRINRGSDHRSMHLKAKHAFNNDFFSDAVFERSDLRPVAFAPAGTHSFTVRPVAALEAGDYALCGGLPEGGWMRACYEFHIGSSAQ